MLRYRILPQSEVIRAILLDYSPCCGVPHQGPEEDLNLLEERFDREPLVGVHRGHGGGGDREADQHEDQDGEEVDEAVVVNYLR